MNLCYGSECARGWEYKNRMRINDLLPRNFLGPFQEDIPEPLLKMRIFIQLDSFPSSIGCCSHCQQLLYNSWSDSQTSQTLFILLLFEQKCFHWVVYEHRHPITLVSSGFVDVNYIVLFLLNLTAKDTDCYGLTLQE